VSAPILDYSTSISERNSHFEREPLRSGPFQHTVILFQDVYKRRQCPHCEQKIETGSAEGVVDVSKGGTGPLAERFQRQLRIKLWGCTGCGWWLENVEHFAPERAGAPFRYEEGTLATLRRFEVRDRSVPLSALKLELRKHPEILYDLHSHKFEQLVGAVISEHYKVDAKIVGRAGDRGVDVILLDGDSPVAIQVKRRMDADAAEGVLEIREFLGAMVAEGYRRGKLVTTAARFTAAAVATRDRAVARGAVQEFELVDVRRFYELFKSNREGFPWSGRVDEIQDQWRARGVRFTPFE
jgi:hypothetical protein